MRNLPVLLSLFAVSSLALGCSGGGGGGASDDDDDGGTGFPNPGAVDVPVVTGGLQAQLPDLSVDVDMLANGAYGAGPPQIVTKFADPNDPNDCAYVEGCYSGSGTRQVLLFDVGVRNNGPVDLYLGSPFDHQEDYVYSPCHEHFHYENFAEYELRSASGVVATGRKQAFCLMDIDNFDSDDPTGNYDCAEQGITVGWADIYDRSLDCQWIDVTDVPPGDYTLSVHVNAENKVPEAGPLSNIGETQITIE